MLPCLLFFLMILFAASSAQPGFISLQSCAPLSTIDQRTKIIWKSDNYLFHNVGICKNVYVPSISSTSYKMARIFGTDQSYKWCYRLAVVQGQDYLVRATFLYGPILRSMPDTYFNISIGSSTISRINSSLDFLEVEGVFAATNKHINICLLKGKGNAYISNLELRPLNDSIYLNGRRSSILKLVTRVDVGNKKYIYRYPSDSADRQWMIQENLNESSILHSSSIFPLSNSFMPLKVLQTATEDVEQLGFIHTNLDTSHDEYHIILYFLELNADVQTGQRVFDIYINGDKLFERFDILENGRNSNLRKFSVRVKSNGYLNIALVKASNEIEYGPICNAYEIFQVFPRTAETAESDVHAMEKLKNELIGENPGNDILRNWHGDPCVPYPWEGLACEQRNGFLVVTKLILPSKNLQGPFPASVIDLEELKEIDVQNNNFRGSVPESFTSLLHLSKLSVKCNPQLNNKLPPGLLSWPNLTIVSGHCGQDHHKSKSSQQTLYLIGSITGGSVALTVAVGMIFMCFYKRSRQPHQRDNPVAKSAVFSRSGIHDLPTNRAVKSFSLQYIKKATCNYKNLIGEGGFGIVYRGTLPNGEEVAVKVRSATSTQGTREFDNEVNLLSSIWHENLVPLHGYCCENDQQILVYPFMSNGSLQDRLYGEASKRKTLDWPTRLSIALGAARGLMYLHTFAGRCIIHRDVKSSNILLDHNMCGKVADFGFSKYAPQDGDSGASLEVRGTAGYLDPEYYSTQQLSTKSDVFSFGVVLLEIVTGREPLSMHRPRNEWSLLEWAKLFIRESRIEEIVDPSIKGGYHAEAMWRVVEAALACIEPFSTYRPSMVDIVRELEDALIIENNASEYMRSIESIGSIQFLPIEGKMIASPPTPTETSPCPIMAVVQPR